MERRRYKRVVLNSCVDYRSQQILQYTRALNISEGGMFLTTENTEPPNTSVEIIFNVGKGNNQERIQVMGRIVWCREKPFVDSEGKLVPSGIGIEFTKFLSTQYSKFIAIQTKEWE